MLYMIWREIFKARTLGLYVLLNYTGWWGSARTVDITTPRQVSAVSLLYAHNHYLALAIALDV